MDAAKDDGALVPSPVFRPLTMRPSVVLRMLTKDDFPSVLALELTSFRQLCRGSIAMAANLDDLTPNLSKKGRTGIGVFDRSNRNLAAILFGSRHPFNIECVAVHPDYRRHGYGSQLVKIFVDSAREFDPHRRPILFRLPERWVSAQLFAKACGFRCVWIESDFYPDRQDALLFRLDVGTTPQQTAKELTPYFGMNTPFEDVKPLESDDDDTL